MKYRHSKTGNVIDTPFKIKSKAWKPLPEKKPTAGDAASATPDKKGK